MSLTAGRLFELSISATLVALLGACSSPAPSGGDDATPGNDAPPGDDAGDGDDAGEADADPADPDPDAGPDPSPDAMPAELTVCASGGHFATLAAAIVAAAPNATLLVCPGTYHEHLVIDAKPLTLIGTAGAASTFLDASGTGTAISIRGGADVSIEGFTIRNGDTATEGGGVRCDHSTLRVAATVITGNGAFIGAGLYAHTCALELDAVRFEQNESELGGGAMAVASTGTIHDSQFYYNRAVDGAGLALQEGSVTVRTNEFRYNVAGLHGGGIYSDSDSQIEGNNIIDNTSNWTGGGITVIGHAPLLLSNNIGRNSAGNDGGGVYLHISAATVRGNVVTANHSGDDGGGIRAFESPCRLETNTVDSNTTADSGGGIRISHVPCVVVDNLVRNNFAGGIGGGMDLDNDSSTIRGGEITGNRASGSGGGIHAALGPWTGLVLEDILIADNRAWRGAGLFVDDNFKPVTMRRLRVIDNIAGLGGGLMIRATDYTITDSVFAGNDANKGGAIYAGIASTWNGFSSTMMCPCPPTSPIGTIDFVVMSGNTAEEGSAVWSDTTGLSIENSIIAGNGASMVHVQAPAPLPDGTVRPLDVPRWSYNDTTPATFVGMDDPTGSDGNMSVDPMFSNAGEGDFHLRAASACIDAGDPDQSDPDGTRADMGLIGGTP